MAEPKLDGLPTVEFLRGLTNRLLRMPGAISAVEAIRLREIAAKLNTDVMVPCPSEVVLSLLNSCFMSASGFTPHLTTRSAKVTKKWLDETMDVRRGRSR